MRTLLPSIFQQCSTAFNILAVLECTGKGLFNFGNAGAMTLIFFFSKSSKFHVYYINAEINSENIFNF